MMEEQPPPTDEDCEDLVALINEIYDSYKATQEDRKARKLDNKSTAYEYIGGIAGGKGKNWVYYILKGEINIIQVEIALISGLILALDASKEHRKRFWRAYVCHREKMLSDDEEQLRNELNIDE